MIPLEPLGDRAWQARFPSASEAAAWAEAVRRERLAGVLDVVAAYETTAVFADPDQAALDDLEGRLRTVEPGGEMVVSGRLHLIPVIYDGDDLAGVASRLDLDIAEVIDAHSGRVYDVLAIGFLPGFPYAGPLAQTLTGLPRRDSPRPRVPAGSIAIAGFQTVIYPTQSPGGWHLLGRTPLRIADLETAHFPIRVGDRLRFEPIDLAQFNHLSGNLLP